MNRPVQSLGLRGYVPGQPKAGGGREKEDLDTFVKDAIEIFEDMEAVGLSMDLVKYVRSGKGDPRSRETVEETLEREPNPEEEDRKKEALRSFGKFEGVSPPDVDPSFLEKSIIKNGKVPSGCLRRTCVRPPAQKPFVKAEPEENDAHGAPGVVEPTAGVEAPDVPLQEEEHDKEGLTTCFVLLDKATATSRLHLPARGPEEGVYPLVAAPRCGLKGAFAYVQAGEAIDPGSEPCARCFGRRSEQACKKLCSVRLVVDGFESRCTRRCSVSCSEASVHLCHVRSVVQGGIMMSAVGMLQLLWIKPCAQPGSLGMTSQGDIPASLRRVAIRFDLAESDFLVMQSHGIHSLNSLAFKLPKAEDLEVFLPDKLLSFSAYTQDDGEAATFSKIAGIEVKSNGCPAAMRRAARSHSWSRWPWKRLPCPADWERPSLFTLNKLGRALQTPGATYDIIPWESYISKEEEDRLMRDGKLPKTQFTELVFREDKVVAKEKSGNDPPAGVDPVGSIQVLRARPDIRARAMDMLELAKYTTVRALSDKYYSGLNAPVAEGMRCPTINELRRCDRELQVIINRHLSRGSGSLEEALTYYANNESDPLWKLLDPVLKNLPDQGVDQSAVHQPRTSVKRKSESLEDDDSGRPVETKPKKRIKCLVCGKVQKAERPEEAEAGEEEG
eukprot:s448_g25.t1